MSTYKIGEFSNSTDQDAKNYFSGEFQEISGFVPEPVELPSGIYRIENGRLVPAEDDTSAPLFSDMS